MSDSAFIYMYTKLYNGQFCMLHLFIKTADYCCFSELYTFYLNVQVSYRMNINSINNQ